MSRIIRYLQVEKAADAWPDRDDDVPVVFAEPSCPQDLLRVIQQQTSCTGARELYLQTPGPDSAVFWQDIKNVSELPGDVLKVKVVQGPAPTTAAGAHLQEKVTLKFKDAAGVQHEARTPLCSRRLHKDTLNLYLGAQRLVLVEINGEVPGYDQNGLTLQAFEPGQVIELTTEVSPGAGGAGASAADNQLSAKMDELCSYVKRVITDSSSQTVDASKVTIEEIEQVEAALQAKRVLVNQTQLRDLRSDGLAYRWIDNVDEDAPLQVSHVLPWLQEHLLPSPLQQRFEVININKKAAAAFPKASFAEMPRHYRGRADYLVLQQKYSHLEDASDQRKYALVVFELKKQMSITALAQARLGFLTYGAYANAALLYVFTDLNKGGVLFWAQQVKDQQRSQLQVHQEAISGMKKLFGEVQMALGNVPEDVMGGGTRSRSRQFLGERLMAPERDTFSIAGLQHPQLLPGQLLSRAMAKLATSSSEDREDALKAWFPHGDGEPVRFDTEDAPEHPAAATGAIQSPSWKSMFG